MRVTPDSIDSLKENEIFVFGSNEAGIHGAGAARLACEKFGALYGKGLGFQGNAYAIPTKDKNIKTLPLLTIKEYITIFEFSAKHREDYIFYVTKIGCGLARYTPKDIAPLFTKAYELENVYMPKEFLEVLYGKVFIN